MHVFTLGLVENNSFNNSLAKLNDLNDSLEEEMDDESEDLEEEMNDESENLELESKSDENFTGKKRKGVKLETKNKNKVEFEFEDDQNKKISINDPNWNKKSPFLNTYSFNFGNDLDVGGLKNKIDLSPINELNVQKPYKLDFSNKSNNLSNLLSAKFNVFRNYLDVTSSVNLSSNVNNAKNEKNLK